MDVSSIEITRSKRRLLGRPFLMVLSAAVIAVVYEQISAWVVVIFPGFNTYKETIGHAIISLAVIFAILMIERRSAIEQMAIEKEATRELFNALLEQHFPLGLAATESGLTAVFPSRKMSLTAVDNAIKNARSRILILGVALKEELNIESRIEEIVQKIRSNSQMDVRFLLMNPLTPPGVFRSIVETRPDVANDYLNNYKMVPENTRGAENVYENSKLFVDCKQTFQNLDDSTFLNSVRFYRRDPTMWMVLVDDNVYIENYTFGRAGMAVGQFNMRLGGYMPVFKFEGPDTTPFKVLLDHFNVLWRATQDDLFHMRLQYAKAADILKNDVFEHRLYSLVHVVDVLKNDPDRRSAPRRRYQFNVKFISNGVSINATLVDCSYNGIGIRVEAESWNEKKADIISFFIDGPKTNEEQEFSHRMLEPSNKFRIIYISEKIFNNSNDVRIGLKKIA